MSNNWICPEDGTSNSGNYCSNCGRQRPKYAAGAATGTVPKPVKKNHPIRNALIALVVGVTCYNLAYGAASSSKSTKADAVETPTIVAPRETPALTAKAPTEAAVPDNYVAGYDWNWEQVKLNDGSFELSISAASFGKTIYNVEKLTIDMDVTMNANTSCKNWQVWIRSGGSFKKAATIYLPAGDGFVSQTIRFTSPASFDAIAITPTVVGGYSWSMSLALYDFYLA